MVAGLHTRPHVTENARADRFPVRKRVIIEVEGYDGEGGSIVVTNLRAERSGVLGMTDRIYCIGELGEDGVVRFLDWGYATAEEARDALKPR